MTNFSPIIDGNTGFMRRDSFIIVQEATILPATTRRDGDRQVMLRHARYSIGKIKRS